MGRKLPLLTALLALTIVVAASAAGSTAARANSAISSR